MRFFVVYFFNVCGGRPLTSDNALLTGGTARYMENQLDLNRTDTPEEKSNTILRRITDAGLDRLESIAVKIVAEMIKG